MAAERRLLDSNLIVRHLVQDHEQHSKIAGRLFEASDRGLLTLVIVPVVLAECVFVLESVYQRTRAEIADNLTLLIGSPGIELQDRDICIDALKRYRSCKMHFIDCTLAAAAALETIPVASLDAGFKRFSDVVVEVGPGRALSERRRL